MVEWAFRACKTNHLEVRPVFVRSQASTRGHVVVVILAYLIVREIKRAWRTWPDLCDGSIHNRMRSNGLLVRIRHQ